MPNWQPNWNDVRWNWGAAAAASNALRRAAGQLDQTTDVRASVAGEAQQEWRGHHRETFDVDLRGVTVSFRSLAEEMRAAANRIDAASDRARAEQNHRERERDRWRREKEREERERRDRERRRR